MAIERLPEEEMDLTDYLQEGGEGCLILCGTLTVGQTEYLPFILYPTSDSIHGSRKAKYKDGWKLMPRVPTAISQRYVCIEGTKVSLCRPETADMNDLGLIVVGNNKEIRIGL